MITQHIPRSLGDVLTSASSVLSFVMALWVVFFAFDAVFPQRQHANIVLGLGLAAYYFLHAAELAETDAGSIGDRLNVIACVVLGVVTIVVTTYVHFSYVRWIEQGRLLVYSNVDLLVGVTLIYVVTDATFRKYGTVLGLVVVGTIAYGLFGAYLPGILGHGGLSIEEVIRRQTITLTGIYGFLLQVGATWIAIFIVFAGLVEEYGGFDYILEVGDRIKKYSRSGTAQSAVITSMFMGTMMGSSASNVATTGSFTIPLMQEHGIPPRAAAAIESVASTGGQILPPIMGTAAFIMANILGVPFSEIAIAGIIPALLFYAGTAISIHFLIVGRGWHDERGTTDGTQTDGNEGDEPTTNGKTGLAFLARGLQYILPIIILIYVLIIRQFGPLSAGLYTIGAAVAARGIRQLIDGNWRQFLMETVQGFQAGGRNLAPFLAILASLGIVINLFSVTGLAQRLAFEMVDIAGGSLVLLLAIAMLVSLLLGLGMPTPAAYVLVATILAPVLTEVGIPELSAHFYIFYFALLSALTPPVALAVTVAMSISGSDFVETVKAALVIGGPTFVIPFMFITHPQLLEWTLPTTIGIAGAFVVATVALVVALTGFSGSNQLAWPIRVVALGLFLVIGFAPMAFLQAAGAVVFGIILIYTARDSESRNRLLRRSVRE